MCAFWGESGAGQIKPEVSRLLITNLAVAGDLVLMHKQNMNLTNKPSWAKDNQKFGGFLSLESDDHSLIHCTASSLQLPSCDNHVADHELQQRQ